jgi:hypothetical protein
VLDVGEVDGQEYTPIARWSDGNKLVPVELNGDNIEYDPFTSATKVFNKLEYRDIQVSDLSVLVTLTSSGEYLTCLCVL